MMVSPLLGDALERLEAYRPADPQQRAFQERLMALLDTRRPAHRDQFKPGHLTASAFILSPRAGPTGGAMLLIWHEKLQRWLQPGGHIEPDDRTLVDAARREIHEETGIADAMLIDDEIFDLDIHEIPARKADPAHLHFDVRFLFRAPNLEARAGDGVGAVRWVDLVDNDDVDTDQSVRRAFDLVRARG